ncbi:penicillin acylase family protein [Bermanella sp. R86510]|uniref:penicillin acylase family protein n=1 Tax=unclassified Bermanella TaxID=2627862 RepID=UPI0037C912B5
MNLKNIIKYTLSGLIVVILIAAISIYTVFRSSLPQLDGSVPASVNDSVTITRDQQGIPTIQANSRVDTAYGLGFIHAQERLFQMDLLRKNSAGELSELFGDLAIEFDKKIRKHQFRKRAQRAVDNLPLHHKSILEAYTQGVNAGIEALSSKPFEYHLLQTEPAPWQHADSALVLLSMYMDLQPEWSETERSLAVMKDLLPQDWFDFMTSPGGKWDAPVQGEALTPNSILPERPLAWFAEQNQQKVDAVTHYQFFDQIHYGSNNWSVSGNLTKHGIGMVADDMHLSLRVPNIWYRASWFVEDSKGAKRRLTGASLPGAPAIVVGSNEHIAWAFTNSQGDFHDVIVLQTNEEQSKYLTKDGYQDFVVEQEKIQIKGQVSENIDIKLTQWGPVIGENHKGELLAMRWVAHDVEGINFRLLDLEQANTVDESLSIAAQSGVPAQNFNVVDNAGNQAWTIMGRIPQRFGFDTSMQGSQLPQDWSNGDKGWSGYVKPENYPKVVNPENGRIWTANARIVSDDMLEVLGTHRYALGARQQQIRDGMFARDRFTEQDFLDIQLDDRALFLTPWQEQLLLLTHNGDAYTEVQNILKNWQARASATSSGYLLVKRYRETVVDKTMGEVYRYLEANSNEFWADEVDNFIEYAVWQLVTEQPSQHIPMGYDSWNEFLLATLDETLDRLTADGGKLAEQTWGEANTLAIKHPLSAAVPGLSWLTDMPAEPMNGDTYMPLVQKTSSGASQRMAVAPGREEEGYFHMATGQSGHPLSPYFDKGHRDWVEGRPSNFLPAETKWTLKLIPK